MSYFENKICPKNCNADCNECEKIIKERKALEFLKDNCDFEFHESMKPYFESYRITIKSGIESITIFMPVEAKDKFDLLKEVLL